MTNDDLEQPSPFYNIFNSGDDNNKQKERKKKTKKITFEEYDLIIWKRKIKQTCIAITFVPILHFIFKFTVP